jgi:hypothetical protein
MKGRRAAVIIPGKRVRLSPVSLQLPVAAAAGAIMIAPFLFDISPAWSEHIHGGGSIRNSRDHQRYEYYIEYKDRDAVRLQDAAIAAEEEARREAQRCIRRDEIHEEGRAAEKDYLESQEAIRASSRAAMRTPRGAFYRRPGMNTTSLPEGHEILFVDGREYYFYCGIFYSRAPQGFHVVTPPAGAMVSELPPAHLPIMFRGKEHFYYFGTFFTSTEGGYSVISPPEGIVVPYLPDGYDSLDLNGSRCYVFGEVRYQPVLRQGILVYTVVGD